MNTKLSTYILVELATNNPKLHLDMIKFCELTFGPGSWAPPILDGSYSWAVHLSDIKGKSWFRFLNEEDATTFRLRWC